MRATVRMAHQLKNPLTAMKALVQLGLRNPAEGASHERLAVLEREIARMQEIVTAHLSSARQVPATQPVHLAPVVSRALRSLAARADGARVRISSRGDACVEGDPRRIEEALVDLVANGIDATPPGGDVVVEVCPGGEDVEIVVRDTGHGIPPEALRLVGTPYFTTRPEGTGLGVALARSVFAQHGGSLRYESAPGRGTTARATLPAGPRAA